MSTAVARRDFDLPEEDTEHLDALGFKWETVTYNHVNWLLLHEYDISEGYTFNKVTAALRISPSYPTDNLDMVYFHPSLIRKDGKPIGATQSSEQIEDRTFQRWSRHYPWRPGIDNISTHLLLVNEWLSREFRIR